MQAYEKLGVFYLGREYDLATKKLADAPLLYDSRDLVTHAVCVGMTGSGKTGLCIGVLEEAAIDNIPAIVIDPKGDLANLLLTFPNLSADEFKPWVNADDARRAGVDPAAFADQQATLWKDGLAKWDEDADRVKRLKESADFTIYTPGSSAGVAVSILKSFAAPDASIREDGELFRDRIASTVTSILGLLGVDADPLQSREHIFLSALFNKAWTDGQNLDLPALIRQLQQPPIDRVGVMDVDSFYPQKERFALAMQMNNLIASPAFAAWGEGEPLDIQAMLYTPAGKPRISIFSISHLGDNERMFFVSLLLNQMLGWTRRQSGTSSLRALLYMDEIFGYFPPSANPPSKQPLLTLLKQARAFGVGVMLATQNPVDLDYKGLANCGTWFIGRLQTERDKMRVLDGLEGASANASHAFDRATMDRTLSALGSRVFLMNNVHDDAPTIFQTRWTLSYLRGPLGRDEIKTLMRDKKSPGAAATVTSAPANASVAAPAPATQPAPSAPVAQRPILPAGIRETFLPTRSLAPQGATLTYTAAVLGTADVYFCDRKSGVDLHKQSALITPITNAAVAVDFKESVAAEIEESDLADKPEDDAAFAPLPAVASNAKNYAVWSKAITDTLYRIEKLTVFTEPETKTTSKAEESERDFRARLAQTLREDRDKAADELRRKYESRFRMAEEQLRTKQAALQKEQQEATTSKWTAAASVATSVLGAFFGRKTLSASNIGKIGTAARTVSGTMKQSADVGRASDTVESYQQKLAQLHADFDADMATIEAAHAADKIALESVEIRPKKTDVKPRLIALVWLPNWKTDGTLTPAWQ